MKYLFSARFIVFFMLGIYMSKIAAQDEIILIADPRILAVPIYENHMPMVDIKDQNMILIGPSPEIPDNTDYTRMREIVYAKLVEAQALLPEGLHFCLYEGYRSVALQKKLFDTRYAHVKKIHPDFSDKELFDKTIELVSPVINFDGSINIPPHTTGAAIDVYLVDENGIAVDMGMHPADWTDEEEVLAKTDSTAISPAAQNHRKIMSTALSSVGFVNYPTEYWHWSYGDRYWAYHMQQPHAIFDMIKVH